MRNVIKLSTTKEIINYFTHTMNILIEDVSDLPAAEQKALMFYEIESLEKCLYLFEEGLDVVEIDCDNGITQVKRI